MKKIDIILDAVKILAAQEGVTTQDLASFLKLERCNVSRALNELVRKEILYKDNCRPVKYHLKNNFNTSNIENLDQLAELYPSLIPSIKLAKTAILYPPNGMNCIILGETGVGKSLFARLMHQYANSLNRADKMPFIHFNCSDYANNVQLLSAHLFGVKKGTYTGATEDRIGLIEQADGGILFLDEIHSLPSEGQEMLFIFMDTGCFNRFGDSKHTIKSSARIICATNKDANSSLLETFIRRIPVKINLPSLKDRSIEERLTLIEYIIRQESLRFNLPIYISYNSMLAFLSYDCPYNIGQLQNDLKLAAANAYADFSINNKKQIKINSPDLNERLTKYLHTPLIKERELLNSLDRLDGYFKYDKDNVITSHSYLKKRYTIIESYKKLLREVSIELSLNSPNLDKANNYFNGYLTTVIENMSNYNHNLNTRAFDELIDAFNESLHEIKDILSDDIIKNFFHIHLDMIYERNAIMNINCTRSLAKLKILNSQNHQYALALKSLIEKVYNINLINSEILFLNLFINYLRCQLSL